MKNYFIIIFISTLIVITSVVKNSTRKLEAKIFNSEEQIKILSDKKINFIRKYISKFARKIVWFKKKNY